MKRICFLKRNLSGIPAHVPFRVSTRKRKHYGAYSELVQVNQTQYARIKKSDLVEFDVSDVIELDVPPQEKALVPVH